MIERPVTLQQRWYLLHRYVVLWVSQGVPDDEIDFRVRSIMAWWGDISVTPSGNWSGSTAT